MATDQLDEERERILGHVTSRLSERFPQASRGAVDEAAQRAWASLEEARVREFLEIFVEREAIMLLRSYAARPLPEPTRAGSRGRHRTTVTTG